MNDYNTECPICGGVIYLVAATMHCRARVQQDGWDLFESPYFNTEDERFVCGAKCGPVPSDYMFGKMGWAEAEAKMRGEKWST